MFTKKTLYFQLLNKRCILLYKKVAAFELWFLEASLVGLASHDAVFSEALVTRWCGFVKERGNKHLCRHGKENYQTMTHLKLFWLI